MISLSEPSVDLRARARLEHRYECSYEQGVGYGVRLDEALKGYSVGDGDHARAELVSRDGQLQAKLSGSLFDQSSDASPDCPKPLGVLELQFRVTYRKHPELDQ